MKWPKGGQKPIDYEKQHMMRSYWVSWSKMSLRTGKV